MKNYIKYIRSKLLNFHIIRYLDLIFRNFISKIILVNCVDNGRKILVMYGGMGDCIGWFKYLNRVSRSITLVLAIPRRYEIIIKELNYDGKIIYYDNFINLIFMLRNNYREYCFVHVSPIFELYLVRLISGLKCGGGYLKNYSTLYKYRDKISIKKNIYTNFYLRRLFLLEELKIISKSNENNNNYTFSNLNLNNPKIIINLEKSNSWNSDKIADIEYEKIINVLNNKFHNPIITLVGLNKSLSLDNKICKYGNVNNLIGKLSPMELVNKIKNSDLVVTLEAGIAHLSSYFQINHLILQTYTDVNSFKSNNAINIINSIYCSPCIYLDQNPRDVYPPICENNFKCTKNLSLNLKKYLDSIDEK